jgi:hypothetical protein
MEELLAELTHLTNEPLNDLHFSFGPQQITDPETGKIITTEGYSVEKNPLLIHYISNVSDALAPLPGVCDDLAFLPKLVLPNCIPDFVSNDKIPQYLKINCQIWLIKLVTAYDCLLRSTNSVFEIGLQPNHVNEQIILQNDNITVNKQFHQTLKSIKRFLTETFQNQETPFFKKGIKKMRNDVVHANVFEHSEILDLSSNYFELILLDASPFDFQHKVGHTSVSIFEDISKVNNEFIYKLYTLVLMLIEEYRVRCKLKLKE